MDIEESKSQMKNSSYDFYQMNQTIKKKIEIFQNQILQLKLKV